MTKRTKPDDLPFPEFPVGRFACGVIDIPWHFESRAPSANPTSVRSPQRHYPTISVEHAATIPVREILAPDAFLFLWITGPHLILGSHIKLAKAWRMRLSSLFTVWVKTKRKFDMGLLERSPLFESDLHVSTGFTSQQNAEYVVLMRCGSPRRLQPVRQILIAPVAEHSRKPDEFFKRVEAYCVGPRIDMFAGRERPGWTSWGHPHRAGERGRAA